MVYVHENLEEVVMGIHYWFKMEVNLISKLN